MKIENKEYCVNFMMEREDFTLPATVPSNGSPNGESRNNANETLYDICWASCSPKERVAPLKIEREKDFVYERDGAGNKKLFIPVEWWDEVEEILFSKRQTVGRSKRGRRAAAYFLHRCHLAYHTRRDSNGWDFIPATLMGLLCGSNQLWAKLKREFVQRGIIEINEDYLVDCHPMSFRITTKWEKNANWELRIFEDFPIISDLRSEIPYLSLGETAGDILKNVALMRSEIPHPKRRNRKRMALTCALHELDDPDWDSYWTQATYDCFRLQIENFSNKYIIGKTGRLYTSANMMPKEIRSSILILGSRTVELDVKTCQPLLLACLYPWECEEKEKYRELVEKGDIYKKVAKEVGGGIDRDFFKNRYFVPWLFGEQNEMKSDIEAWFRMNFPILWQEIQRERGNDRRLLPCKLQGLESDAIWKTVNAAGIPHLSTHDGVRVREEDKEEAEKLIRDAFWNLYGLVPQINTPDVMEKLNKFLKVPAPS